MAQSGVGGYAWECYGADMNDMKEWLALLAEYTKQLKKLFHTLGDAVPSEVQEAYAILFQVGEIFADPSVADQKTREVIYSKVPRDRIVWALDVLEVTDNWLFEQEDKSRKKRRRAKKAVC